MSEQNENTTARGVDPLDRFSIARPLAAVPAPVTAEAWPAPTPLDAPAAVPAFPVHMLPPWLRNVVAGAADVLQVPADLPGAFILPLIAGALAHRCIVAPRPGWEEPSALYSLVIANSGEKKSPVASVLTRPIVDIEHAEGREMAPEIRKARSTKDTATKRAEYMRSLVVRGKGDAADLEAAERELDKIIVPVAPRYVLGGDATPEALGKFLAEQEERMLVATPEGGAVEDLTGLRYAKSTGVGSYDLILKAHDGDRITIDRVTRDSIELNAPLLNLALAVQPDVFRSAADNPALLNRGVLARFLTSWPDSRVGYRDVTTPSWPEGVLETYGDHMRTLWKLQAVRGADGRAIPRVLPFSPAAWDLFTAWRADAEVQRRPGAMFSDPPVLLAWSNKLDGTCARLAGILHVAERVGQGDSPLGGVIDEGTLARAITLCDYFAAHAVRAFATIARADPAMEDAVAILATLRHRQAASEVSARDVKRMRSGCTAERAEAAAVVLCDRGWLREKPAAPRTGPGRPPARVYEVHPSLAGRGGLSGNTGNVSRGGADASGTPSAGATVGSGNTGNDSPIAPTTTAHAPGLSVTAPSASVYT